MHNVVTSFHMKPYGFQFDLVLQLELPPPLAPRPVDDCAGPSVAVHGSVRRHVEASGGLSRVRHMPGQVCF